MKNPRLMTPPSAEALAHVRQIADRQLSAEEFEAYVRAPMSDAERQEILDSVAWFMKRYPTAGERLASARLAYKRWAQGMPDYQFPFSTNDQADRSG
jgi:hypothetical protein